tara:strand:+ start:97 stop:450 length:354 start_codon:yes stop_codon:yes gene_type:complete
MDNSISDSLDVAVSGFNVSEWSVKVLNRTKDRMKITFKLSKDESEAFQNFQNNTKPDDISEDQFIKSIFFLGLTTLETNLHHKIAEEMSKHTEDEEVNIPDIEDEIESVPSEEESVE